MRLPVTPQLSTKDGISNKNARLTNTLKETAAQGEFAVVRPGILFSTSIGYPKSNDEKQGKGIVSFNDNLISVYGSNLCDPYESITTDSRYLDVDTHLQYAYYVNAEGSTVWLSAEYVTISGGENLFSISTDGGSSWTASAPTVMAEGQAYTGCPTRMANGEFFIPHSGSREYFLSSNGGAQWSTHTIPSPSWMSWSGVLGANNGSRLVINGSYAMYSDDNGISFSMALHGLDVAIGTIWDGDKFVSVLSIGFGSGFGISISSDGVTWIKIYENTALRVTAQTLSFRDGVLYFIVQDVLDNNVSYIASSSSFTSWNFDALDPYPDADWVGVAVGDGSAFALAYNYYPSEYGLCCVGKNTIIMNPCTIPDACDGSLRNVAYAGGRYLATNDLDGRLIEFVPRDGIRILSNTVVSGDFFDFAQSTL